MSSTGKDLLAQAASAPELKRAWRVPQRCQSVIGMRCRLAILGFGKSGKNLRGPFLRQGENSRRLCFHIQRFAGFNNLSPDAHGLRHEFEEGLLGKRFLIEVGKQEDGGRTVEIIRYEDGGDAATNKTHCAVPMALAASRVHHSQIAFAIPNLS